MNSFQRRAVLAGILSLAFIRSIQATEIVFDPTNFGANVEQVLQHLEIITRLDRQIRNQYLMLENWRFTLLHELLTSMQSIREAIEGAGVLDLANRYSILPQDYARLDSESMQLIREQWLESQRQALIHSQTLQNRVVTEIPGTQHRVEEYVARSNSARGQTAVLQASNETLATLTAQLQNLQALDIAQTRIELEEDAHRQAQAAFYRQRRENMMKDWPATEDSATPQPLVRSLFEGSASK